MNERLKILRKTLELTQQQFGEEIGAKRNTIAVWECGAALPGNRAIKDICREFDINEVWLRTGEGKMMAPKSKSEQIAKFITTATEDEHSFQSRLIHTLAHLNQEQWDVLETIADDLASQKKSNSLPQEGVD